VTSELQRAQESIANLRDVARQHHLSRAKISSKLLKYPLIDDYAVRVGIPPNDRPADFTVLQIALREHDERQLHSARRTLHDLRTMYAVLTDIIHKNITKVFPLNAPLHSNRR